MAMMWLGIALAVLGAILLVVVLAIRAARAPAVLAA
jgi:hypothetical protein